jgi:hypothetical protein
MENTRPPAPKPEALTLTPDPRDFCTTCGRPIDVVVDVVWIRMGAGVDAGVEHDRCR